MNDLPCIDAKLPIGISIETEEKKWFVMKFAEFRIIFFHSWFNQSEIYINLWIIDICKS